MAAVNPCYQCTDRDPYCHGQCKKYADWKILHEAEKVEMAKRKGRYGWTYAQKRAYYASRRRDNSCATKKFSQ